MNAVAVTTQVDADIHVTSKPHIEELIVVSGTVQHQTATVTISLAAGMHKTAQAASETGPLDAIAKAIGEVVPHTARLKTFRARSLGEGTDSIAEVMVVVAIGSREYRSRSNHRDTNLAFARAYLGAVNMSRSSGRR